jgi:PAS domain S-box-containing protein
VKDEDKTKEQLITELVALRQRVAELETLETDHRWTVDALRNSEAQYRTTLDSMGDAIHVTDETLRIVLFNDALRELNEELGLETDIVGKTIYEIYPFLSQKVRKEYDEVFKTGQLLVTEESTQVGDREFITETRKIPIFEGGEVTQVITVIRDITEHKVAEEALARERNLLRTLIDNLPDYIYAMDTEGRFVLANMTIARYLGAASPDELLGKTNFDFYPPELAARHHVLDQEIMQSGQSVVNREESATDLAGNQVRFLTNAIPSQDSQGKIMGLIGITRDITERVRAEEEIRWLKEFNEGIVQNMAEGIVVTDSEGYFTFVNPAAAALLGYAPEDLLGRQGTTGVPPDQQPVVQAADERRARGQADRYELELVRKDGVRLSVLVSGSPRFEGDRFAGTLAVFTDITERKRAEEEREKLIAELQDALTHIKMLSGLLPICASCKRIRDDQGYWQQVEVYIRDHSEAEFSHGLCPDCAKKLYPGFFQGGE